MTKNGYINYILIVVLSLGFFGSVYADADENKKITIVLHDDEKGEKAWLGVQIKDLTRKLRQELDTKARYGVVIDEVVDNSPADEAGLEPGDVIVKLDNKNLRKVKDLTSSLGKRSPEDEVQLEIMRGNKREKITVILGSRADNKDWIGAIPNVHFKGFSSGAFLGVEVQELNEDLAEYFDVHEDEGVLVTSVDEDGPAMEAGIRAGDVLFAINGEEITDAETISDVLSELDTGSEVELEYVRKGRKESSTVLLKEGSFTFKSFNFPKTEMAPSHEYHIFDSERYKRRSQEWKDGFDRDNNEHQLEMEELRKELDELRDEMKRLKEELKQ